MTTKTALPAEQADASSPESQSLHSPELYINRELSLLEFQRRVLEEAQDPSNPLLERVKFLAILSSNLDEFFMVRVAGLQQQVASGLPEVGIDGRPASAQLQLIRHQVKLLTGEAQEYFSQELKPALEREGLCIVEFSSLCEEHRSELTRYFHQQVFPVLTPLAFDPGRPFPHISTLSLNLAVLVGDKEGVEHFARVKVPDTLPQLVPVGSRCATEEETGGVPHKRTFVWLEQLIAANLPSLFSGLEILGSYPFRVTRDAEVAIQELESDDLLDSVEDAVRRRRFAAAIRVQADSRMSERIQEILTSNLEIDPQDVYCVDGPLNLNRLMELYALERPDLKDKPVTPFVLPDRAAGIEEDMFGLIRHEDILLHHPFESFQPVVDFLELSARDPDVLAIKMTLYRVGRKSPIVAALLEAVENGKQVAVLVELKARFDEESNIEWARTLESEGVHVVYGLVGRKVHSKIAMVIRREGETIRRYLHLGTGNYNPSTARMYTDFGFFTCNEAIGEDAIYFFNALTGYSDSQEPSKLLVAGVNMRQRLEELILREIRLQEKGESGHLIFKMNALEDPKMIELLYRASRAGVKVELLVRGICCLRPGLPGVSENIRVTSIVGRFLEHSRVYYFRNAGAEEIYLGSADLMRRNLDHRIEILFPVENPKLVRRLKEILGIYLKDQVKVRRLQADGKYVREKSGKPDAIDSQAWLLTHHDKLVPEGKRVANFGGKRRNGNGRSKEASRRAST